jgi:geranylgeranyl diphosphate synthase type II
MTESPANDANTTTGDTPNLVAAKLREYGLMTRVALSEYLPSMEPRRYLYDLISDYPNRGGKMMRPSLCIAAARLFGARAETALNTAVAIELLHNALLIHDDIEDGSEMRRGEPTLHRLHGLPLALNAGDMLTLTALEPLMRNRLTIGDALALRVIEETQRMARASAEGQAVELGWRRDNTLDLNDADYLDMVLKKTCWLGTIYPLRVGAMIGSGGRANLAGWLRFGYFLGAAFQIQDDLLNLDADTAYGKECDGDLWEGKRTLILIHAYRSAQPEERLRIARMLECPREQRIGAEVAWLKSLIAEFGSDDYARRIANQLAGVALHEYSLLSAELPSSSDKDFLAQMSRWVIERN